MTDSYLRSILLVVALLTMIGCDEQNAPYNIIPEVEQTQYLSPPKDLRNYRYCEIIPVFRVGLTMHLDVYNTMLQNDCPQDAWRGLKAEALAEQYGATRVVMNGPRFWVLNGISSSKDPTKQKVAAFNGIEMRQVAAIEMKIWQVLGRDFFEEMEVKRTTVWHYDAGNTVYELISPAGDVYRMQSYAQIVDSDLSIEDMENLEEKHLNLPEGWRYEARTLRRDAALEADGLAIILQDNLYNTYQKIDG